MRVGDTPQEILAIGRIPREPFQSVLRELLQKEGYDVAGAYATGHGRSNVAHVGRVGLEKTLLDIPLPMSYLAGIANVKTKTLLRIINGTAKSFSFDDCDKILCALDAVYLWRMNPDLNEQYETINLEGKQARDPVAA